MLQLRRGTSGGRNPLFALRRAFDAARVLELARLWQNSVVVRAVFRRNNFGGFGACVIVVLGPMNGNGTADSALGVMALLLAVACIWALFRVNRSR